MASKLVGRRAVVVGAGIGGLAAARALVDHFEQVVVLERDMLPLVVHPLSCCGIWHDGDAGAARGAVPPSAAPDEGMLVRVPVRGGTPDGLFDLGPGLEAAPFEAKERRIFHHGSIRFR